MGGSSSWSSWTDYIPRELRNNGEQKHMTATMEAPEMWQQTAEKCHRGHKNAVQSPKAVTCSLPRIILRSPTDAYHPMGYSYYWSNSCFSPETREDLPGELGPISHHLDYHSKSDESFNGCFFKLTGLQSLAAESASTVKSGPQLISSTPDCYHAELELEWQFITDPQNRLNVTPSVCELCKNEDDVNFEEAVWCDTKHNAPEHEPSVESSNHDVGLYGSPCTYGGFLSRQQLFASNVGDIFQDTSEDWRRSFGSSLKSILSPQSGHKEVLAGQVAQSTQLECFEDHKTCPEGRVKTKVATTSSENSSLTVGTGQDIMLQNSDRKLLSSLPDGSESSKRLDKIGCLASSPSLRNLDPAAADPWKCRLSDSRTLPIVNRITTRQGVHSFSSCSRNSQFSEGGAATMEPCSELLAEALCHSQTRAREAEKKMQRASEEKERLMRLFFKEAYLAFTYRQWVTSLQSENMWLRMSPPHPPVAWLQHSAFNPFSAWERLSCKRWKHSAGPNFPAKDHGGDQDLSAVWNEKSLVYLRDPNEIMMGYTLAFAMGLSLAGAGLMLGWSMGWILLSY